MKVTIEYLSMGKWYFWKNAASEKEAVKIISMRENPCSQCRIKGGAVQEGLSKEKAK